MSMDDQVVGVLGGGQLGRMLLQAASPIGVPVISLDPQVDAPAKQVSDPSLMPVSSSSNLKLHHIDGAFTSADKIRQLAEQVDVLTIEIEHVDVQALNAVAQEFKSKGGRSGKGVKVYPAPEIIAIIQDKFLQKQHLAANGIPVAPFRQITASPESETQDKRALAESILAAGAEFGYPLMLKSRHLAYDGRGNFVLRSSSDKDVQDAIDALIPDSSIASRPVGQRLYAEKFAPFVKEAAVMVVRAADGQVRAYPAVETIHRDNICHIVYAPLRPTQSESDGIGREQKGKEIGREPVAKRAQHEAQRAISALGNGAVGVFGVEMFLMKDGSLLLNEIAPRPHNSGHYTIESCSPSQYTSHLYSILGLPLPPIAFLTPAAAMLNLLGATSSAADDFMKPNGVVRRAIEIGAAVHLYGKSGCRKGRKMGHVTVCGYSDEEVYAKIAQLVEVLPSPYNEKAPALLPPAHSSPHPLVSIVMGSDSDLPVMKPASAILASFQIPHELSIVSAHRTPARMVQFAQQAEQRGVRVIIAGAGGAAHLPGMVASETTLPVIGVPVKGSSLDGVDSLYSIVQMPRGIPVATMAINNSTNAALLAARILSVQLPRLTEQLARYAHDLEDEVMVKVGKIADEGWDAYVVKK